jgi:TetR/AcrR family transcriptional regulator
LTEHQVTGQTRRTAILDAAVAEFSGHGYHGARIERIAASAHVNKQLIFHYFESKNGLYEAVVSGLFPASPIFEGRGATPLEAIGIRLIAIAGWLSANPGAARVLGECSGVVDVPAAAAQAASAWIELQANALCGAIEDGQRRGFFRDDVDAQTVAAIALGSLVGRSALSGSWPAGESGPFAVALSRIIADYCAWR